MRVGLAVDHRGFSLKETISGLLKTAGHEVVDFGAFLPDPGDDYPDFVIPLARAVAEVKVERGVAVCGSGVGASIVANKVKGVRAAVIGDLFSARQGVEDDDMNVMCLAGHLLDPDGVGKLLQVFLTSRFSGAERHRRRLAKVAALEQKEALL
jgi:RpiB/LacA/LacB family sugar-phosphate isomerase